MRRLIRAFSHAFAGLAQVVRSEANARIHLAVAALVVGAAMYFRLGRADWLWLVVAIGIVWSAEAMNTAFEYLCDAVMPDHSEAVKRAKDIAAGATLIAALSAAIIGILVFWPYLM